MLWQSAKAIRGALQHDIWLVRVRTSCCEEQVQLTILVQIADRQIGNRFAGQRRPRCVARIRDPQWLAGSEHRTFKTHQRLENALHRGRGRLAGPERAVITSGEGEREVSFDAALLATGSRPRRPDWAEIDEERIITYGYPILVSEGLSGGSCDTGSRTTGSPRSTAPPCCLPLWSKTAKGSFATCSPSSCR